MPDTTSLGIVAGTIVVALLIWCRLLMPGFSEAKRVRSECRDGIKGWRDVER